MDWVTLEKFWSVEEAQLALGFLQAEGVSCQLEGLAVAGNFWHLSNAAGGVKLLVANEDVERAAQLLADVQQQHGVVADDSMDWYAEHPSEDSLGDNDADVEVDTPVREDGDDAEGMTSDEFDEDEDREEQEENAHPGLLARLREHRLWITLFALMPLIMIVAFVANCIVDVILLPFTLFSPRNKDSDEPPSAPLA